MKTLQVGEFKAHFSEVINDVKAGEEIIITYGKKKENVAVIIPYSSYKTKNKITLGLLKETKFEMADDFAMTEEDLLGK